MTIEQISNEKAEEPAEEALKAQEKLHRDLSGYQDYLAWKKAVKYEKERKGREEDITE